MLLRKNLLKALLKTPDLEYLVPLNEQTGNTAYDISGAGLNCTYSNVTLFQTGLNPLVPVMASFNGSSSIVTVPVGASCKGKGVFTRVGVIEIVGTGLQNASYESCGDSATVSRFTTLINDKKCIVYVRTGLSSQTVSSFTSTDALTDGVYLVHVEVDIPNDTIKVFANGTEVPGTTTINWGTDTIVVNTDPLLSLLGAGSSTRYYAGRFACSARYGRLLSAEEKIYQSRMGGFI